MNEVLTPERVLEIGEEWTRILIQNLPAEKLNEMIAPEYKQAFFEEGREEGREEGKMASRRETVLAMYARAFPVDLIADVTSMDIETVRAWIEASTHGSAATPSGDVPANKR